MGFGLYFIFLKFHLLLEIGEGREREREGEKHGCDPAESRCPGGGQPAQRLLPEFMGKTAGAEPPWK